MKQRKWFVLLAISLLTAWIAGASPAKAALDAAKVPTFKIRVKVTQVDGKPPAVGTKFSIALAKAGKTQMDANTWSDWIEYTTADAQEAIKRYPNLYLKRYPVVNHLTILPIKGQTDVQVQIALDDGKTISTQAELFGQSLGILVWRDADDQPMAGTMADYNQRYWEPLKAVNIPEALRPRKFPLVDRFIGGDNDMIDWRDGIDHLAKAGFTAIANVNPSARPLLLKAGLTRTSGAIYAPPGLFDMDGQPTDEKLKAWAQKLAAPFEKAGFAKTDVAMYSMSDEPGWYYPAQYDALKKNPAWLKVFHDYLASQGLKPQDVGAQSWATVEPLGRSHVTDMASRRLYYWTTRFFPWNSSRQFARASDALQEAFYKGMPVFTNWNFFTGRFIVPGAVANNRAKGDPDAGMGGHDWGEFAKLHGGSMLWTEDWFDDAMAYQWSYYAARLSSAARRGGEGFGGYVVPRVAGSREDGILQKILAVIGSGGKGIYYFVFGPEYNFPGNCYSFKSKVLVKMAEAHQMIGTAEDVLWPGQRPRAQVAFVFSQSSQPWDGLSTKGTPISDATNNHLNRATVDYMAETYDLYLAFQHANIPVDFLDEDQLTPDNLKFYNAVYVTAPNMPVEYQEALIDYVKQGGTLVTVTGALQADRYDQPTHLMDELNIAQKSQQRTLVANTDKLPESGKIQDDKGTQNIYGPRGTLLNLQSLQVLASFDDHSPALVQSNVGKGHAYRYTLMPGLSYWRSRHGTQDKLPVGFSPSLGKLIVEPALRAGVSPMVVVDQPMVESPILLSDAGAAVTLLNWTGKTIDSVDVSVRLPFKAKTVTAVKMGALHFTTKGDEVMFNLPLGAADIVSIKP